MSEGETIVNYREEVLRLAGERKIRHTIKYVEKASDETVEKIYKDSLAKQLDETNEHVTDTLIKQLSELMTSLELVNVDDRESFKKDLGGNELFKRDVKNALSYVTPYIPFVGLVCGGICIAKYVMKNKRSEEPKKDSEEPKDK